MCEKCDQIDKAVVRLKNLANFILDRQTFVGMTKEVCKLEAEKAQLHPELRK
jgi:hypothetical protein